MGAFLDLTGTVFGRWTVIARGPKTSKKTLWRCRCECGVEKDIGSGNLRNGTSLSCGCLRSEVNVERCTKHGHTPMGGKLSPTYHAWLSMKQRCTNPKKKRWADYGGRGIKVCERWMEFANFLEDMGERPPGKYSIDRINNDGDYEPSNCRWATTKQQARNTRHVRKLTLNGETLCISEWAEKLGIKAGVIRQRLHRGMPTELALSVGYMPTPKNQAYLAEVARIEAMKSKPKER